MDSLELKLGLAGWRGHIASDSAANQQRCLSLTSQHRGGFPPGGQLFPVPAPSGRLSAPRGTGAEPNHSHGTEHTYSLTKSSREMKKLRE